MSYFEAFLYGVVQGLTEYLPISSSAHLILLPRFLGTQDPGLTFDVFMHLGTLAATLSYFWRDWVSVGKDVLRREKGPRLWKFIVLATIPALAVGAVVHGWVETALRGNLILICSLSFAGLFLFWVDYFFPSRRTLSDMTYRDALAVGFFQCLALIPGVSRSGATITAGRMLNFGRDASARFSFLISAPVTAAALVFELRNWPELLQSTVGAGPLIVAALSSFVFGWIAIGGLLRLLKRFGYFVFAFYRIALAITIYVYLGI